MDVLVCKMGDPSSKHSNHYKSVYKSNTINSQIEEKENLVPIVCPTISKQNLERKHILGIGVRCATLHCVLKIDLAFTCITDIFCLHLDLFNGKYVL
jgi:hypothetical protein